MRQRLLLTLSLLLSLALTGAVMAAPPPYNNYSPAPGMDYLQKKMIEGRVESVQGQRAYVRTHDGGRVQVNLGPQSYWRQKGYDLRPGAPIRVQGFARTEGDGPVFAAGIWGPDFYFELTNDHGFPYWADQDDYWDGWTPTYSYYDAYYCGPAPYAYGPPPPYWAGPPPPPWWFRHHHYYGRPGFRWGWHDGWRHGWNRGHGGGHGRYERGWRGGDDGDRRGGDDRGRDGWNDGDRRGGRRGH